MHLKQTARTVYILSEKIINHVKRELFYYKNHLNIWIFLIYHRKNACDGVGATVKRLTCRASSQNIYDKRMNPKQMYDYLDANVQNIQVSYK